MMNDANATEPAPANGTELRLWSSVSAAPLIICGVAAAGMVGFGIIGASAPAVLLLILVPIFALVGPWRVTVSSSGLVVRAVIGIPVFRIAAKDVSVAEAVTISALRDFLGWGIRSGSLAAAAVVTGNGESLRVETHRGRTFLVTVAGAERAAVALRAAAEAAAPAGTES